MAQSGPEDQRPEGTPPAGGQQPVKQLHRSTDKRILLGVCGGLGEYFDVDPVLVRVIFVLLVFAGFSGIFLYVVLAFIMPSEEKLDVHPREAARSTLDEAVEGSRDAVNRASGWVRSKRGGQQPAGEPPRDATWQQQSQQPTTGQEPPQQEPPRRDPPEA